MTDQASANNKVSTNQNELSKLLFICSSLYVDSGKQKLTFFYSQ